ncbi:MAG: CopG family transcriptional regulator [Firmicutes bacterium]|nr:CopG family transcriptional regulator [Bacillota bacterium]
MSTSHKKVVISLPHHLLQEVDRLVQAEKLDRSQLVAEAMAQYLQEHKRARLREELKEGYIQMAGINLQLAEEGTSEIEELYSYEEQLAEAK